MKPLTRREFLSTVQKATAATVVCSTGMGILAYTQRPTQVPLSKRVLPAVIRPPGALNEKEFLSRCIRCTQCTDACTAGAIRIAGPNDGYIPRGTPFIDPHDTACVICLECAKTCPTDALLPLENKEDVNMGLAVVDEDRCVSHNGSGVCGACHTACPFRNQAITQGLRNAPEVDPDYCVGCGLCEEACIVEGVKAIRVFSERSAA